MEYGYLNHLDKLKYEIIKIKMKTQKQKYLAMKKEINGLSKKTTTYYKKGDMDSVYSTHQKIKKIRAKQDKISGNALKEEFKRMKKRDKKK